MKVADEIELSVALWWRRSTYLIGEEFRESRKESTNFTNEKIQRKQDVDESYWYR